MAHVRGTRAPDSVVLQRLANAAGDPLRGDGAMEGSELEPNLMRAAAASGGHCVYLPEVWGKEAEYQTLEALALDIARAGSALVPHRTQKRMQIFAEDLKHSKVFSPLIGRMLAAFGGLSLVDAWVNVYRDGLETTGAHQDHYNLRTPHACATLNLNLGATRHLCCEHIATGERFYLPQANGSLFAFDAKFNCAFRHSVPPERKLGSESSSLRLSITVFAIEGPQPPSVTRDLDNVPPGVPLTAHWTGWDFSDSGWQRLESLPHGFGASKLMKCGPLMRGHGKGVKGGKSSSGKGGQAKSFQASLGKDGGRGIGKGRSAKPADEKFKHWSFKGMSAKGVANEADGDATGHRENKDAALLQQQQQESRSSETVSEKLDAPPKKRWQRRKNV